MEISRREFLKIAGLNMAAFLVPFQIPFSSINRFDWPILSLADLPSETKKFLRLAPKTFIDPSGFLNLVQGNELASGKVPLTRTLWNLERSRPSDRLEQGKPWGIVLHWYGEKENFDKTAEGYLRGFDSLRQIDDYITRTSAHFLVADGIPSTKAGKGNVTGILQTQAPDIDGAPYLASHLKPLDYQSHHEGKQYFVRALYQLGYQEPGVHSILQDFFDGPRVDANKRTFAIEITGHGFEYPENQPTPQQIANALSVIWAIMKRYGILATNILGHNEIQLGKADPGKKFMALIRYLLGAKALIEDDEEMKLLIFGQFLGKENDPLQAVQKYFSFIRDYLVLVGTPVQVYEWEKTTGYWFLCDKLSASSSTLSPVTNAQFIHPFDRDSLFLGDSFLIPENHEGIDLYYKASNYTSSPIHLMAKGKCVFLGESAGLHPGKLAMFRHRLTDGGEIVSVFSHLKELGDLQVERVYPQGYDIGAIESSGNQMTFLHFAIAYGATWETDLRNNPHVPLNAGASWIRKRYLEPLPFITIPKNNQIFEEKYL